MEDLLVAGRRRGRHRHGRRPRDSAPARVVLTTGTFLRGLIHRGEEKTPAGAPWRGAGQRPLAQRLLALDLRLGRLKTGTPARLDGRTIDWAGLEMQAGDDPPDVLSRS